MKRFFKLGPVFAACALAAAVVVPGSAGAAPVPDQSYRLASEGTLSIGATDFAIPTAGTGFTGTWDDATGEFTDGVFTVGPDQVLGYDTGIAGTATLDISTTASGPTGTLDPASGQVDLASTWEVTIAITLDSTGPPPITTCTLGPLSLSLSSADAGGSPFNPADPPDTWAFTVADAGFSVPTVDCDLDAAEGPFNDALGLPSTATNLALSFESGVPEPPVTPPPPPPAPPAPAPEVGGATAGAGTEAAGGTELPRTGSATPGMAAVGLVLVATGLWLTRANTALRRVRAD